jgi:hypothetical protein
MKGLQGYPGATTALALTPDLGPSSTGVPGAASPPVPAL